MRKSRKPKGRLVKNSNRKPSASSEDDISSDAASLPKKRPAKIPSEKLKDDDIEARIAEAKKAEESAKPIVMNAAFLAKL